MKPYIPLGIYLALMAAAFAAPEYSKLIASVAFFMALGHAVNIFVGLTRYVDFGYVAFLAMGAYGVGGIWGGHGAERSEPLLGHTGGFKCCLASAWRCRISP